MKTFGRKHHRDTSLTEDIIIFIGKLSLILIFALTAWFLVALMGLGVWDGLHTIARSIQ